MITLRPHQEEYVNKLRQAMVKHKAILLQAPCGMGKTVVAAYIAKACTDKGNSLFFTVHRNQLITQTKNTFDQFNIEHGIIAASYKNWHSFADVQICSINTLKNRMHKYNAPTILVIDECHFSCAAGWSKVIEYYKNKGSWIIGLTASPWRMSGEGLGKHFDIMIEGKPISWLIEHKYLSTYKVYCPPPTDISKVHVKMGDFVQDELELAIDKKEIIGDVIRHWRKYAEGKRTLAFCVSVKHSKNIAQTFNDNGIPAYHLDAETPHEERNNAICDFADGKVMVLTSCNLMCEGFDLSSQIQRDCPVEAVCLLRPTMSVALHTQQIGRALRYKPYPAIILDHANNVLRHSLPDDEVKWTLEGKPKNKKGEEEKTIPIKSCPECFYACPSGVSVCPDCGHVFEPMSREVDHKDGDLLEIDPDELRKQRMKSQALAKTKEDLVKLGIERKYKYPAKWAEHVFKSRESKKKDIW